MSHPSYICVGMRIIFSISMLLIMAFGQGDTNSPVNWISFEQMVASNETASKKIFIDVYTDWCGWCKRMDATTFSDPRVAEVLENNFYNVKFNAEQRESITFNAYTFNFVPNGRKGYHELAAALLNGKLSYPSVVFLNEKYEIIQVLPGYRKADEFLKIATFFGEDHYLTTAWEEYSKKYDASQSTGD